MRRAELQGPGGARIVLLGVAQGLLSEAEAVRGVVLEERPDVVGLQLGPGEVHDVLEWGPIEPDTPEDALYLELLSEFGDAELPPPDLRAAHEAADEVDADVAGVDLPELEWVNEFTRRVSTWELMTRGLRMRRRKRKLRKPDSPEAFCDAWDDRTNTGSFAELEAWREKRIAKRAAALVDDGGRAVVIVEAARFPGVQGALERAGHRRRNV